MNKTMYEVSWHHINETFTKCTISPITVTRLGILPGCSAPTIDAIDSDGRKFQGNPDNYFDTEAEAWESTRKELLETIAARTEELEEIVKDIRGMSAFLADMNNA